MYDTVQKAGRSIVLYSMVQNDKKKPGRPRAYDPQLALDAALDVFWRTGFAATSLDDLTQATGMNRPSIYAAFGDKHALYLQAMKHYHDKTRVLVDAAFNNRQPIRVCMHEAYKRALDMYYANMKTPLGCFMMCTVVPDVTGDAELRDLLMSGLQLYDDGWRGRIERAQKEGEISKRMSADSLAKIASGALYYMAIRSRAGEPRETLERLASDTIELICNA